MPSDTVALFHNYGDVIVATGIFLGLGLFVWVISHILGNLRRFLEDD